MNTTPEALAQLQSRDSLRSLGAFGACGAYFVVLPATALALRVRQDLD